MIALRDDVKPSVPNIVFNSLSCASSNGQELRYLHAGIRRRSRGIARVVASIYTRLLQVDDSMLSVCAYQVTCFVNAVAFFT